MNKPLANLLPAQSKNSNIKEIPSPAEVLKLLQEGNERFTQGLRSVDTMISVTRLQELSGKGQNPLAVVLTCSDSRAPTEIIFDRGIGDLYVLRVAGNVLSDAYMAGIEYAVHYFNTPLVVVLGHTRCGAVKATADCLANPAALSGLTPSLKSLVGTIRDNLDDQMKSPEELAWQSVRNTVKTLLRQSKVIQQKETAQTVRVVGAICDLLNGKVTFDAMSEGLLPR